MALSVVNVTKIETSAGVSVSGAIADMAADSLMVAAMTSYGGTVTSHQISDSENGAYSTIAGRALGSSDMVSMHFHQNTVLGSGSSGNCSGSPGAAGVVGVFYEISGASTATAFTSTEFAASSGNSAAPNAGNVVNANTNAIIIAAMGSDGATSPITYGVNGVGTLGTYSQNTSSGRELVSAGFPPLGTVYQIVASSGTQTHIWANGSTQWVAVMAAFSAGGGAATPAMLRRRMLMGVGV